MELSERFGIEGIPSLILIDAKTGKTISDEGRAAVAADPDGKEFPWNPKPVAELGGPGLNERACLMLLFGDGGLSAPVAKEFETVAKELITKWLAEGIEDQPIYFYQSAGGALEERVREVLSVEGPGPKLILMNLPAAERFVHTGELNADAFRHVALQYAAGELATESLR